MDKFSINCLLLVVSFGLIALVQVQATDDFEYSDAIAACTSCGRGGSGGNINLGRGYKPYRLHDTGNPEVTESHLIRQLDSGTREVYFSMDNEGRAMARQLAGDNYRYNKREAVRAAFEMMQKRNHHPSSNRKQNGTKQKNY